MIAIVAFLAGCLFGSLITIFLMYQIDKQLDKLRGGHEL